MVLSERQREDLHRAIAEYFQSEGFENALSAFLADSGVQLVKDETEIGRPHDLLVKKWTSVVRLQKKVTELECKISELESETSATLGNGVNGVHDSTAPRGVSKTSESGIIPRPPALHTLSGHRAAVTRVICHPVFPSTCVSASDDASIKVWDMESGRFERSLTGHTDSVQDLAFDPGSNGSAGSAGRILASCSADLSIKLWDFESKFICIRTLHGHDHNVSSLCFVSVSRLISVSRDKSIKIWDVETGFCIRTLTDAHSEWIRMVRHLPQLNNLSNQRHPNGLTVATTKYQTLTATCSNDHHVRIWSFDSIVNATSSADISNVASLSFHHQNGNCYLSNDVGRFPELLADLNQHQHVVECITWSPHTDATAVAINFSSSDADSKSMKSMPTKSRATGPFLASGGRDRLIHVWDLGSIVNEPIATKDSVESSVDISITSTVATLVMTLTGHDNWIRGLTFHPTSGKLLLSASDDRTVRVWDLRHRRCLKSLSPAHEHFVTAIDFHHRSPFVISSGVDQTIKVWECR